MKRFLNLSSEARALIVSTLVTLLGVGGTAFLFWLQRYDIPLAILMGGSIVVLSWLAIYLVKRSNKPHLKLDIAFIYIRLFLIVALAITFAVLKYSMGVVIVSPVILVVSYLVVSLSAMAIYLVKGEKEKDVR